MKAITVYSPAELKEVMDSLKAVFTVPASEVVKQCKGVTPHELRKKYPFLKELPSLWTRSYFVAVDGKRRERFASEVEFTK